MRITFLWTIILMLNFNFRFHRGSKTVTEDLKFASNSQTNTKKKLA